MNSDEQHDEGTAPEEADLEEVVDAAIADDLEGDRTNPAKKLDSSPGLIRAAKGMRALLPGDKEVGDSLSDAGRPSDALAKILHKEQERPSAARELGLAAVQVFQAMSDSKARADGTRELAILFTDLVEFSSWALDAGDEAAVKLLREVAEVIEPAIQEAHGQVVKRLGDGYMAVFSDANGAVEAALQAQAGLGTIEVGGYRPALRAGAHVGTPRKVGKDYLGVDVNIAARVADAASGGEVLISAAVLAAIDEGRFKTRKRRFRAKGAPRDLDVFVVSER